MGIFKVRAFPTALLFIHCLGVLPVTLHADSSSFYSVLSQKEKAYLKQKQELRVCVDPHWFPFEAIDPKTNKHVGYSADFLEEIRARLSIPITLKSSINWSDTVQQLENRKCDFAPLVINTPERQSYLNFTDIYLNSSLVLVAQNKVDYIEGLEQLMPLDGNHKPLAVVKDYAYIKSIKQDYPEIQILEAESLPKALQLVDSGEAYAALGSLYMVLYQIRQLGLDNLKVAGPSPYRMRLSLGARNDEPLLISIFNKALNHIPDKRKHQIYGYWSQYGAGNKADYQLIWQISGVLLFCIFVLYWRARTYHRFYQTLSRVNERLKESNQKLEELSNTDVLTGVYNRRKLIEVIEAELNKGARYGNTCSLIMFDIDHFKNINDSHGHQAGDRVLKSVSLATKNAIRETDSIGRWGGEEFIVLLPETELNEAKSVATKLQLRIKQLSFAPLDLTVTASFGVATYNKHEDCDTFIHRADEFMYQAKENGRDQVITE